MLNLILDNLILDTDSYKFSHFNQMPPKTTRQFSYLESRGGRYLKTVQFGPQMLIQMNGLDQPVTVAQVNEADEFAKAHGVPFNRAGWERIVNKFGGHLPIKIRAVPEGSVIPTHNVLMTSENLDPESYWATSYVETMLMRAWYPITVATQSWHIRQIIMAALQRTADDPENEIWFKLHDFGARGVSSRESAMLGGAAHLVSSMGSDTVAGVWAANKFYDCKMAGFSIPAMEHSTVTSWGGPEQEGASFLNMLDQNKGAPILACVSDSYNIYEGVDKLWCGSLLEKVKRSGTIVVIRPDSGEPVEVLTKLCKIVEDKAGVTYNSKGFKVFNYFRFIWGDGINEEVIRSILAAMEVQGYSATNFAFGMGGALLQQVNRDTQKFAYKCSHVTVDGHSVDVYKDPITDPGKKSKRGLLDLVKHFDKYETVHGHEVPGSVLQTIYEHGKLVKRYSLDEVRKRAAGKA